MTTVTEQDKDIIKGWYDEARKQTPETVGAFIQKLMSENGFDYGSICHALAASALAGAYAADRSEQGGITGFQSGFVMWQFVKEWLHEDGPMKMVRYDNMLYPQYEDKFQKTMTPDTFKWLQEQAAKKLADSDRASPSVVAHWQSIVDGTVPFGYVLTND